MDAATYPVELVAVASLRPHPENYKKHPDDQLEHLAASIRQHGFFRDVVVAADGTILAGHGVVLAAQRLGLAQVPAKRLPISPDSPAARKILAIDNELGRFAEVDDRMLTNLLRGIRDADGLLGTGYDDQKLAALILVTRPESEIADHDAAKQWVGLPAYQGAPGSSQLVLNFKSEADRAACFALLKLKPTDSPRGVWWPAREREDLASVRMEVAGKTGGGDGA